jgi:hypothetical protein
MPLVGGIVVVIGGLGVVLGLRMLLARRRYVLTRGVVVSVRLDRRPRRERRGSRSRTSTSTVRYPTVRFTDTREAVHEVEVPVGTSWDRHVPGQAYDLYFDPADPSTVLPRSRAVDLALLGGFGVFLLVGLLLVVVGGSG